MSGIQIENLVKTYGDNIAVNGLNLNLEKGKVYGFLGPNGAGKSTTMNIITGYIGATSGTVKIDGYDIFKEPEKAKKCVGYLPEIPPLYQDMTVKEYLVFVAELKKIPAKEKMKNRKTPIASFYANLMAFDGYYEKKWFPYTMPISDIYGLRAAFNLIAEDATLYERHARIGSATRAAVKEAGLKLHLQSGFSNTVTVFDIPQCTDAKSILDTMRTKYNIMLAGSFDELSGKVIRIGHMGENARLEHMVPTLEALSATLTELDVTLKGNLADLFLKYYRKKEA